MGLFSPPKTSTDYLKDIAKSQKKSEESSAIQAEAAQRQARAAEIEANAKADVANAEAEAIRRESARLEFEYQRRRMQECQEELDAFYAQFDYSLNDINDIIDKCEKILKWIDSIDRKSRNKKSQFKISEGKIVTIADDNKSKENTLGIRLNDGIKQLERLNADKHLYEHIEDKIKLHEERLLAERKARIAKIKIISIAVSVVAVVLLTTVTLLLLPNAKTDYEICNLKIALAMSKGDIEKATKYVMKYKGYDNDDLEVESLINVYLEKNDLFSAELIAKKAENMRPLIDYFVEQGLYEKAAKAEYIYYFNEWRHYVSSVVIHMCKAGKYDEAKKFARFECQKRDESYLQDELPKFNNIINNYIKNK